MQLVCYESDMLILFFFAAPKAKRQRHEAGVAKRLFDPGQRKAPQQSYDITPPSSPEQYDLFDTARYEGGEQTAKIQMFLNFIIQNFLHFVRYRCWIKEILADTTLIH